MRTVESIVKEAIEKYPENEAEYNLALKAYERMENDGHSGMSWSITRSIEREMRKAMQENVNRYGILLAVSKPAKPIDDVVKSHEKEVENSKGKDGFDWSPYVKMCYESAAKVMKIIVSGCESGKVNFQKTWEAFNMLTHDVPLIPIRDTEEVWTKSELQNEGFTTYQCNKRGSLFKEVYQDGTVKYHDLDLAYFSKDVIEDGKTNSTTFHSSDSDWIMSLFSPIKFPYRPRIDPYEIHIDEFTGMDGLDYTRVLWIRDEDTKYDQTLCYRSPNEYAKGPLIISYDEFLAKKNELKR